MADEELPDGTADAEEDAETAALAVDMGGNRMVPLSALIAAKKEGKGYRDKVKELEPLVARAADVDAKLGKAQPIIDAILTDPKLRAQALRIANGTRASSDATDQPDDDPDAAAYAEDMGWYAADGQTLDVARGRRVLARLDARHGRQTDERMRPLAGTVLGGRADHNLREAMAMTDDDGTPLASAESIREVAQRLGPDGQHLMANPTVIDMIIDQAAGIDRRKGRTPKRADEPLYLAGAGGGRSRAPAIDSSLKASLDKLGLTAEEFTASNKRYEQGRR